MRSEEQHFSQELFKNNNVPGGFVLILGASNRKLFGQKRFFDDNVNQATIQHVVNSFVSMRSSFQRKDVQEFHEMRQQYSYCNENI